MGKRVTLFLDDGLNKKLRLIQAKTTKRTGKSVSYSRIINQVIRNYPDNDSQTKKV